MNLTGELVYISLSNTSATGYFVRILSNSIILRD